MDILEMLKRLTTAPAAPAIEAPVMRVPAAAPDVTGTGDMNKFLSQGIQRNAEQAAKDRSIMASLPDLTGTTDTPVAGVNPLMLNPAKPELGMLFKPRDITPTPFPTPVVSEERFKETAQDAANLASEEQVKPKVSGSKAAPKVEVAPEVLKEEVKKELTIDDLLSSIKKPEDNDREMVDAQESRRQNRLAMALGKAAEKIGAGVGGTKSDSSYLNDLQPMVDAPVADLKEKREAQGKKQKEWMDLQKFTLDTERGKQDYNMAKLQMKKATMDLTDAEKRNDPNSDASQLAQASTLDALKRMGRKDLASQVSKKPMSAQELDKAFGTMSLSNMVTAYEAQQNRIAMAQERNHQKDLQTKEKMDQTNVKRLDDLSKRLDADLTGMRTPLGKNANLVNTAERLQVLVAGKKPKDITNQQLYELAAGLDAMLTAGSSTVSGREHLLPRGWKTEYAKLAEVAGNAPVGAGQAKFVESFIHTIEREKAAAKLQMSRALRGAVGSYADLAKTADGKPSEAFKTMLELKGISPEVVDSSIKPQDVVDEATDGQYKPLSETKDGYSGADDAVIKHVMTQNNISREEAITALKKAEKLK